MWHNLGSPPENFRFYKFSETSNEKGQIFKNIDLQENKTCLFQNQNLSSVPEESLTKTYEDVQSQNTQKPLSSLKSTSKINSRTQKQNKTYDLNPNSKNTQSKPQSKSLLQNSSKQKSSLLLSQNQKSSIIKEQLKLNEYERSFNKSNKTNKSQVINRQNMNLASINNEQDEFSQIFLNDINKTQEDIKKFTNMKDRQKGSIILQTLIEIRDNQKQQLVIQKKMLKYAEEKGQISFLYDKEEKSDLKFYRNKKQNRKSYKRTQEKSTIKKLGKSEAFEQRLVKVEQKYKILERKIEQMHNYRKTSTLIKTKKKSMSTLR